MCIAIDIVLSVTYLMYNTLDCLERWKYIYCWFKFNTNDIFEKYKFENNE